MRIHSDILQYVDIYKAADKAGAEVQELEGHGSKSRTRAFNFYLTGSSPFRPGFGRVFGDPDAHAASWDEWGIVFDYLFELDPNMHCHKHSYQSRAHFDWLTCNRFRYLTPVNQHRRHKWSLGIPSGVYSQAYCEGCEASIRWFIGGMTWEKYSGQIQLEN